LNLKLKRDVRDRDKVKESRKGMHKDDRGRHREIDLDSKAKDLPLKAEGTCGLM
jgi:hypothetical protein